jgi:hypothetical protein
MKGDPEELRAFWELWEHKVPKILPKLLAVCQRFFLGCELSHNVGKIRTEKGIFRRVFPKNFCGRPGKSPNFSKKIRYISTNFYFFIFFQISEIRWVG